MNHLAHVLLAGPEQDSVLGNLVADDVKGRPTGRLAEGIVMHRRIDTFVDAHPATLRSIQVLPPQYRRYGGIMLDVWHDHLIATRWHSFSALELAAFAEDVYSTIRNGFE